MACGVHCSSLMIFAVRYQFHSLLFPSNKLRLVSWWLSSVQGSWAIGHRQGFRNLFRPAYGTFHEVQEHLDGDMPMRSVCTEDLVAAIILFVRRYMHIRRTATL